MTIVDKKILKEATFQYLKNNHNFSYKNYVQSIISLCGDEAYNIILLHRKRESFNIDGKRIDLQPKRLFNFGIIAREDVDEILWNLISNGIIIKTLEVRHEGKDYYVTEYGKKILNDVKPSPHNYEGYLSNIKKEISNIDEITVFYLELSLQCFNKYLYIPAAIMLGVATESIILDISEIAEKKVTAKDKYQKTLKDNRYQISGHKKAIDKFVLTKMPNELSRNLEKEFNCFFELIRLSRNEAGHPSEIRIDRDEAYGNYIIFRKFCKKAYELKEWLEKQENI